MIETECAHCSSPIKIEIDSDLRYKTGSEGCEPLIFIPDIDILSIKDLSIIDSF